MSVMDHCLRVLYILRSFLSITGVLVDVLLKICLFIPFEKFPTVDLVTAPKPVHCIIVPSYFV